MNGKPNASWRRHHSMRMAVYAALAILLIGGVWFFRSVLSGGEDSLLTRLVHSETVQRLVQRELSVRYSMGSVHVGPGGAGCGTAIEIRDVSILPLNREAAGVSLDRALACSTLSATAESIRIGTPEAPRRLNVGRASASWRNGLEVQNIGWSDAKGAILTVARLRSQLPTLKSEVESVQVLPSLTDALLTIRDVSTGTLHLHGESASLDESRVQEALVVVEQRLDGAWNFSEVSARLVPEAKRTIEMARASFSGVQDAIGSLRRLAIVFALLAFAITVSLKFVLARWMESRSWRIGISFGPALISLLLYDLFFGLLSFASFAITGLLTGCFVAVLLWFLQYRNAAETHERIEPALVDIVSPALILAPLALYGFLGLVPSNFPARESLSVLKSDITSAMVRIVSRLCHVSNLGEAQVDTANASGLSATFDLSAFAIQALALEKASVRGQASSSILPLDRIAYLPAAWKRTPVVAFCANANISIGGEDVSLPNCAPADGGELATVNASSSVNFAGRTAGVKAVIHAAAVSLQTSATAGLTGVRVEKIESLPGSTIGLRNGTGQISWNGPISSQFTLQGLDYRGAAARAQIESIDVEGTIPPPCASMPTRLGVRLSSARVATPSGYELSLQQATSQIHANGQRDISVRSDVRDVGLIGRNSGETSAWLSAAFPLLQFELHGHTSDEDFLPRQFVGEVSSSIEGGNGSPTVGSAAPVRLEADLWRGELQIPEQSAVFQQAIVPALPQSVAAQLSLAARLESITPLVHAEAHSTIQVPHLVADLPPLVSSLNDLSLRLDWTIPGNPQLAYATGWSQVELPRLPQSLNLKSVSALELRTEGDAKALPPPNALLDDATLIVHRLRQNVPSVPSAVTFKVAGTFPPSGDQPVVSLQTQGGKSIRVQRASASLSDLRIADARFQRAAIHARADGITNSKGAGNLTVEAESMLTDKDLTSEVEQPLRASLSADASSVIFAVNNATPLAPLVDQLQPLLEEAGLHLGGVHLRGQLNAFHSEASFANSALNGLGLDATLAAGPLLQLDVNQILAPDPTEYLRTVAIGQDAPLSIKISAPAAMFPRIEASVSAPGVSVNVNEGEVAAKIVANTAAEATLNFSPAGNTSIADKLLEAFTGFGTHFGHAAEVFGSALPPIRAIQWHTDLHSNGTAPAILVDPSRIDVSLASNGNQVRWQSSQGSSVALGSFDLKASVQNHSDHLIFDARIPTHLALSIDGAPMREWNLNLPLLAAFRDHLEAAPTGSQELWDSAYYDRLWQSYQPRHATDTSALVNLDEINFSGVSLRQISLPDGPLQLAAGYAGPLQIHLPIRGSLLYGTTQGTVQSRISWKDRAAAVDSFSQFSFQDIQAGAVGLGLGGAPPTPFLEDTLQGNVQVRTDGLLVDPHLLPTLTTDASRATELDKLGLDLDLKSQRAPESLPGVLQLQTAVDSHFYNQLLDELAEYFELMAPLPTVRYKNLALHLAVQHGEVQTEQPLLSLAGVEIREPSGLSVGGDIRLHWGRMPQGFPSAVLRLRNLLYFLQRTVPSPAGN